MSCNCEILITGSGAVCGAGANVAEIRAAILDGRSAVRPIDSWDPSNWPAGVAAEATQISNRALVEDRKLHKLVMRTDLFGLNAAAQAIAQAGIEEFRATLGDQAALRFNDRSGVFAGSGGGNYLSNYDFLPLLAATGDDMVRFGRELGDTVHPMWLLKILPNNVACHVGIRHRLKGTNACVTNQCVGGALAVAEAAWALRAGEADRAVAIGHDTPCEPETVFHYQRLGLMSATALRPFDRDRDGTVFGEGAAAVMLESGTEARARNAPVLGEFLGAGATTEATGVLDVRTDGDGLARAIELALTDAGMDPDGVGMIVAHGNGTRASDASEARALQTIFGDIQPPVTGFKWAAGHLIAAAGVLDLVLALEMLARKVAPGIATLGTPDPELAPLAVARNPRPPRGDTALVLCRGFGGMNVALLVRSAS